MLIPRIRHTLWFFATLAIACSLPLTICAQEFAQVEELVSRIPKLGPDNPDLNAFSLRIRTDEFSGDIRWQRDELLNVYLETSKSHSPILLIADGQILLNDLKQGRVWISELTDLHFIVEAAEDGRTSLMIAPAFRRQKALMQRNEAAKTNSEPETVRIDLASLFRFGLPRTQAEIKVSENKPNSLRVWYTLKEPARVIGAIFDTNAYPPLKELAEGGTEFGIVRYSRIEINDDALPLCVMPKVRDVKKVASVSTEGYLADLERSGSNTEIAEEYVDTIKKRCLSSLKIWAGINYSDRRSEMKSPKDKDVEWEAIEERDNQVSSALLKVIADAQSSRSSQD